MFNLYDGDISVRLASESQGILSRLEFVPSAISMSMGRRRRWPMLAVIGITVWTMPVRSTPMSTIAQRTRTRTSALVWRPRLGHIRYKLYSYAGCYRKAFSYNYIGCSGSIFRSVNSYIALHHNITIRDRWYFLPERVNSLDLQGASRFSLFKH